MTYNAEEMDVTDSEQKEELAQSLIREWECPAWLETEAGVSVKVALNSTESAGESLNGIEFAVLKAKEPEFIKKIVETGEEEERRKQFVWTSSWQMQEQEPEVR